MFGLSACVLGSMNNLRGQNPNRSLCYSFPELRNNEIIQCLEELGVSLSESDLSKPSPIILQKTIDTFINLFWNEDRPDFNSIETNELFQESIHLLSFYRKSRKLMSSVGVNDFGFKDLVKPEPNRVRVLLSALINFAKFREEQLGILEEINKRFDAAHQEQYLLTIKVSETKGKIQNLEEIRKQEDKEAKKIKENINSLILDLKEQKKLQSSLQSQLELIKTTKNQNSQKIELLQCLIENLKKDELKLRSRIVQNPEILQNTILDMTNTIQSDRLNLGSIDKKSRDLESKLDLFNLFFEDLKQILVNCSEFSTIKRKKHEIARNLKLECDSTDRVNNILKELSLKEVHLVRKLGIADEKLRKLHLQQKEKRDSNQASQDNLKIAYDSNKLERMNLLAQNDNIEKKIKETENHVIRLCIFLDDATKIPIFEGNQFIKT